MDQAVAPVIDSAVSASTWCPRAFTETRQSAREPTDIKHELSHLIRDREPSQIILSATGEFSMRSLDPKQEDEANWLSGTLLLPRDALMQCRQAGNTSEQIAHQYDVSTSLTSYRLRVTAIEQQISRRKRFRIA